MKMKLKDALVLVNQQFLIDKHKAQCAKYYAEHKDQIAGHTLSYYQQNREQCIAQRRAWNNAHQDKVKEYNHRYFEKHKDEINAKRRLKRAMSKNPMLNNVPDKVLA